MPITTENLANFENLAKKVQSLPEKDQRDVCLIIQGYLACNAARRTEKAS